VPGLFPLFKLKDNIIKLSVSHCVMPLTFWSFINYLLQKIRRFYLNFLLVSSPFIHSVSNDSTFPGIFHHYFDVALKQDMAAFFHSILSQNFISGSTVEDTKKEMKSNYVRIMDL
jgi:hypothetical protein